MKKHLLFIAIIASILVSCKPKAEKPEVVTFPVSEITDNSAVCGGNVTSDGGAEVTARGVCWSVSQNPTIDDNKTSDGSGVGSFTSNLINLTSNTTYYIRAYAVNSEGVSYGEEYSFTTLKVESEDGNGNGNGNEGENGGENEDEDEDEDEDEIVIELPLVVTVSVADITETSAVCGGEVTSDGGAAITSRGVCWSVNQNPTVTDFYTEDGSGLGTFTSNIPNLAPNTQYYVRAYATNEKGTSYGEEISFTTLEIIEDEEGFINGYEYVDLGLPSGLKWATHNIGATASHETGDYFAWGETNSKTEFTEANCTSYGLDMQDIAGNPQYDAARTNWGATWKVPSKENFEELLNECTWEWTVVNGVGCKKVTGPNNNYILLPITGYKYGTSSYMDDFGYYWTSTPISTYEQFSYDFFFDEVYNLSMGFDERCYGQTIRPVSE